MGRVPQYHTNNEEYPPTHRNVHHDQSECKYGEKILTIDLVRGDGNRPLCEECTALGT
jgi:hypothetical protein